MTSSFSRLLRVDSIQKRQEFPLLVEHLFLEAGDHVERPLDHLFLFLHCLMIESGFQDKDEDKDEVKNASRWGRGDWKPIQGRRDCYSALYELDTIRDQGQVTLRMTPVGSTFLLIGTF